jgi:hypothetical protein
MEKFKNILMKPLLDDLTINRLYSLTILLIIILLNLFIILVIKSQ